MEKISIKEILKLKKDIQTMADTTSLNQIRNTMYYEKDKSLLEDKGLIYKLEELNSLPTGRFRILYKGIHFDCLFKPQNEKSLYVVFSGYKTSTPPEFKRWSWYNTFGGSMLNIADPSYTENDKVELGWYYGTDDVNYRELIVDIVKRVQTILEIENKDVTFYSSSGGGACAIHCAGLLEGSTAIAINPQIHLATWAYAPMFLKTTGIDLNKPDKWHRNELQWFAKNCPKSNFIFFENCASDQDIEQFKYLKEAISPNKPFHYGINEFDNCIVWLYEAYDRVPHGAQETQLFYFAIKYLVENFKERKNIEELEELYIIFSELWFDHWSLIWGEKQSTKTTRILDDFSNTEIVSQISNTTINADPNNPKYNAIVILKKPEPRTIYQIKISGIKPISGNFEQVTFAVKDNQTQSLAQQKALDFSKSYKFYVTTEKFTEDLEFKIYCGVPGKTNNNSVYIENITISKVK